MGGALPNADRLWRRSLDEVRRMARFTADHDSRLVLAAIPASEQILEHSTRQYYQDVLQTFAADEHIRFVNLIDGLSAGDPRSLYFEIDPHFTPKGHQVTAELLYAATKDMLR
jgi:lysophospholipase L1-like esterase